MKSLNDYFNLEKEIHDYFGYQEDWVKIPLDDSTNYYWTLDEAEDGSGEVLFAESPEDLTSGSEEYYCNLIYTQRFLPKWVYRRDDYTMICVDTMTDGNKFLQIFDNAKEIKKSESTPEGLTKTFADITKEKRD